jgi:thioredoxin-dependent peroxiredoxin
MKPRLLSVVSAMFISSLFSLFARADSLPVGSTAPAVSALSDSGQTIDLADVYQKNRYTLVWFYPKALTGGCTKQGCSLRDATADLAKHDVGVIGVSVDPVEKQKEFKETNHFPFPLLADTDRRVMKAFGQDGGGFAKREAYLIRDGKIVYKDQGVTDKQAENVLAFIASQKN